MERVAGKSDLDAIEGYHVTQARGGARPPPKFFGRQVVATDAGLIEALARILVGWQPDVGPVLTRINSTAVLSNCQAYSVQTELVRPYRSF